MTLEEAIKELKAIRKDYIKIISCDALDMAIEALQEQRPHGHWIERELYGRDPFERNKIIICSRCKASHRIIDDDLKWFEFCPKCGAIMDENFVMMR